MSTVEDKIRVIIEAVRMDLNIRNYYSALVVAFTLPDVTSKLQFPDKYTGERYVKWFEDYMQRQYIKEVGADHEKVSFLTGGDFYALRCSMLHQGETEIINQKARKHLSNFIFLKPSQYTNNYIHRNRINDVLQLQVDKFCEEIIEGTEKWLERYKNNSGINDKAKNLIDIHEFNNFIF
ncbi:hypothetical protein [Aerococcus sp. L_32]|uniref:hypothetical protein n=1 Tax=Aerococcus sp. L_32 TaxID=3422316 RepID=UPI003D6BEB73